MNMLESNTLCKN